MQRAEPSGTGDGDERALQVRLEVLTRAVEVLLQRAERELEGEVQAAFVTGQTSTVLLRQIERDQARQFRKQVSRLRSAQAAEAGG